MKIASAQSDDAFNTVGNAVVAARAIRLVFVERRGRLLSILFGGSSRGQMARQLDQVCAGQNAMVGFC